MCAMPRRRTRGKTGEPGGHDHGTTAPGACDAKSETAPRGDLNVVVGPTTTQERRGWTNDDKRGQGRASRQAHVAQKSQRPQPGGREAPDDHESARRWGMQCQVRRRHRTTAAHDPEGLSRGPLKILQDHGRTAGGAAISPSSQSRWQGWSRSWAGQRRRGHASRRRRGPRVSAWMYLPRAFLLRYFERDESGLRAGTASPS